MRPRITGFLRALLALGATACVARDATLPTGAHAIIADGANLSLAQVRLTQGAQDVDGSIPMVANMAAAVNVLITRSRESPAEVPVVLRLYRGGTLVRTDTAHTVAVLGPSINAASPSAQFLIPAALVTDSLSWQIEIDPAQSVADSTRSDNLLPAIGSTAVAVVSIPPLAVHFVPLSLSAQGDATGNVSTTNVVDYMTNLREMLPTGAITASVGLPLSVQASFGFAPTGGAATFWQPVLQDLDVARMLSSDPSGTWYGVAPLPSGFSKVLSGGHAYIPGNAADFSGGTRSAVSLEITPAFGSNYARELVAHELGHTFGRSHAPGCGAGSPIDDAFPGALGSIGTAGHDVWSWATGVTARANSRAATTGDVMSYCSPVWSSPYTWNAVLHWRQASGAASVASTSRAHVTLVAGSIAADGEVTLRPALEADAVLPAPDATGDVTVELRGADNAILRSTRVRSSALSESGGARHFIAILPTASNAAELLIARTVSGGSATLRRRTQVDDLSARITRSGATEITSSAGNAILARDGATGDVIGIGWTGRVTLPARAGYSLTVSDGVRSRQREPRFR